MTIKRKGSHAVEPRPAVTALGELADELSELGSDLGYALEGLSSAGVALPPDFAASADSALRRALDELAGLAENADGLLPRAKVEHRPGHAPGGRPARGRPPAKRG